MTSTATSNVEMKLIEFSRSKTITFLCQVYGKINTEKAPYDIIIGLDFMEALDIDIRYSKHCITWDGETVPLKLAGTLSDEVVREGLYFAHTQSERTNLLFPINAERELNHQFSLAPDLIKFYQDQDPSIQEDVNTREHTLTTRIPSFFSYRISTHNTHITIILVFGSTMHIKMDTVIPDCSCCCC